MWTEHILNPLTIKNIFKDETPSLKQVKMYQLTMNFGGTLLCNIQFDLHDFPVSAPSKWLQKKCNTVSFNLSLIDSVFTTMSVQGGVTVGDLEINFINQKFEFKFKKPDGKIHFSGSAK
jgi:Immunity protein 50